MQFKTNSLYQYIKIPIWFGTVVMLSFLLIATIWFMTAKLETTISLPGELVYDTKTNAYNISLRIPPRDISFIHENKTAKIRLTAFNQRTTPVFSGKINKTKPQYIQGATTQTSFFKTEIIFLTSEKNKLASLDLKAGMPAQVILTAAKDRPLDYFLSSIRPKH